MMIVCCSRWKAIPLPIAFPPRKKIESTKPATMPVGIYASNCMCLSADDYRCAHRRVLIQIVYFLVGEPDTPVCPVFPALEPANISLPVFQSMNFDIAAGRHTQRLCGGPVVCIGVGNA